MQTARLLFVIAASIALGSCVTTGPKMSYDAIRIFGGDVPPAEGRAIEMARLRDDIKKQEQKGKFAKQAFLLQRLSKFQAASGAYDEALESLEMALTRARKSPNRFATYTTLANTARLYAKIGNTDQAAAYYQRTVDQMDKDGYQGNGATGTDLSIEFAGLFTREDPERARAILDHADAFLTNQKTGQLRVALEKFELALMKGDTRDAAGLLDRAEAIVSQDLEALFGYIPRIRVKQARVAGALSDWDQADKRVQQAAIAARFFRGNSPTNPQISSLTSLAIDLWTFGYIDSVQEILERADRLGRSYCPDKLRFGFCNNLFTYEWRYALIQLGELHRTNGRAEKALASFSTAFETLPDRKFQKDRNIPTLPHPDTFSVLFGRARSAADAGKVKLAMSDVDRAIEVAELLEKEFDRLNALLFRAELTDDIAAARHLYRIYDEKYVEKRDLPTKQRVDFMLRVAVLLKQHSPEESSTIALNAAELSNQWDLRGEWVTALRLIADLKQSSESQEAGRLRATAEVEAQHLLWRESRSVRIDWRAPMESVWN